MKYLLALLIVFNFQSQVFANEKMSFKPGVFALYNKAGFTPGTGCDVGTSLTLDEGEVIGRVAILSNFVDGYCDLYIAPNERVFTELEVSDHGCGSKLYKGSRQTEDGIVDVEIIDHRTRFCRDLIEARIIVTESKDGNEEKLYSIMFKR